MEQRQEMMDDAIDDAMDVGVEEEGDEVVEQVLEEIGVNLNQAVSWRTRCRYHASAIRLTRTETARRCTAGSAGGCGIRGKGLPRQLGAGAGGGDPGDDDLQARLDSCGGEAVPDEAGRHGSVDCILELDNE